jgi:hypothetical protein
MQPCCCTSTSRVSAQGGLGAEEGLEGLCDLEQLFHAFRTGCRSSGHHKNRAALCPDSAQPGSVWIGG